MTYDFEIVEAPQRSPEWFAARLGRATGSCADKILAKIKSGEAATRKNYRVQLVAEILTGVSQDKVFVNDAMQWGIDTEPQARMAYEQRTGNIARETGFASVNGARIGCSLDGDIDEFEGLLEMKCPNTATHLEYLDAARVPPDYVPQITHNMLVTGAQWADFVSFDPRLPDYLRLLVVRVKREDLDIDGYKVELEKFIAEVDAMVAKLEARR